MSNWSTWLKNNPAVAAVAIVFGGSFAITALGLVVGLVVTLAGISPPLGFGGLAAVLGMGYVSLQYVQDDSETDDATDPVTELEHRYVRGELSDEEFEHRLDRIVETEDEIERLTDSDPPIPQPNRDRELSTETK